jgi:hypothetical protein
MEEWRYRSTSAIVGGEWSASRPGHITPCTQWVGGWVGPKAGLDAAEEREANLEEEWAFVVKEAKVRRGLQKQGAGTSEGLKKVLKSLASLRYKSEHSVPHCARVSSVQLRTAVSPCVRTTCVGTVVWAETTG